MASGAAARADHEATKHSLVRLRASRHRLDWSNQPLPDKVYRTLAPHPEGTRLPREFRPSERPALDVIRSAAEEPRGAHGSCARLGGGVVMERSGSRSRL